MNLLVAGGAGYVGSHTVRALCNAGHSVTVLDNLCGGHREAVDPRAPFVELNILNTNAVRQVLSEREIEGVLHFAAHLDVGESVRSPLKYYENNVAGTVSLLQAMESVGIRRFVFSSTCATYGEDVVCPILETTPKDPISPYGRSKLASEWAMEDSVGAWNLGACALRYFNASGAAADGTIGEDRTPEYHLIPLVLQVALGQREKIFIFGDDYDTRDGTCIRDYIHVDDLAAAHLKAIETIQPGQFRAYNVGTGVGTSVLEVIESCRKITGHAIPAEITDRRAGDPPELFANADLARTELGWAATKTRIDDIVESAWAWHQAHPNGYSDSRQA